MDSHSTSVSSSTGPEPVRTLADIERMGLAKLSPGPRFYYSMGADEKQTLTENVNAFKRLRLLPRLLRGVVNRSLETVLLEQHVSMPIGIAPTAFHKMAHPDGEAATAKAAEASRTVMIVSIVSTTSMEDVREAAPNAILWLQLCILRERAITQRLVARAERAGYSAIVYTADIPVGGSNTATFGNFLNDYSKELRCANFREEDVANSGGRFVSTEIMNPETTWADVAWLKSITKLPLVVKGILTVEAAIQAVEHGASAIIVSNHGGRQLDCVPATIDVLPDIVRAVGHRCQVYLDGGVRLGTDIIKALALGARAVFVGRPVLYGLAYNGEQGAFKVLEILRTETDRAMALMGCRSVNELHPSMVVRRERLANL
ncbi:2-Hydroxyacid oxidase 1-like isoform X1 [Dermacentor silvarum]|uniref:2-Hydroxyacid oxidase 1-like isoform X1 n=1 Tax=Dermacentor silvarum TaxID=543639 RepID=UPI00189C1034|nr:2-Hydroxyacid oxidase 1-like isoform X1 [Dermacentor silvarum]XP_049524194.1 2-Hydroxyacid oxidase 1-like isoform X1 [Dermacentor silvarum]